MMILIQEVIYSDDTMFDIETILSEREIEL
jgi:hypothetical protein